MGSGGTAPVILTSPLDGGNQIRAPTAVAPQKTARYALNRSCEDPSIGLDADVKYFTLVGNPTHTTQLYSPQPRHYYDCAVPIRFGCTVNSLVTTTTAPSRFGSVVQSTA